MSFRRPFFSYTQALPFYCFLRLHSRCQELGVWQQSLRRYHALHWRDEAGAIRAGSELQPDRFMVEVLSFAGWPNQSRN